MKYMIDHAISIPAPSTRVWEVISDLSQNPLWQHDCERVTFLTPGKHGKGTRARITHKGGREIVIEVTAWYNGVGYEYQIVDGAPYEKNLGRIRMQQATEGTIAEWTFHYDLGGFLSGVRNSVGTKRQIDKQITESLRQLYTYIRENQQDANNTPLDAPAAMRPAIGIEERQKYQPKYPSAYLEEYNQTEKEFSPPPLNIEEPAFLEDDTRPNPALKTEEDPKATQEVNWLEPVIDDTPQPIKTITDDMRTTAETISPSQPLPPAHDTSQPLDKRDTAQVSIFDVFNLPRPSITQEMRAAQAESINPILETLESPTIPTAGTVGRLGFRVKSRRNLIKLRYPN